jgi:protein gp37
MGDRSKIEWTDSTWNPVTGCTKVSAGCTHCYAERLVGRFDALHGFVPFTTVECHPDRLEQPLHWRKPRRIFVVSMGDLFHEAVPVDFIDRIFDVMQQCPQHTFQILTKRPKRMIEMLFGEIRRNSLLETHGYQPNIWLGVSVENQAAADERIPLLLQTPAAVRFVSYEPALGPVDLAGWIGATGGWCMEHDFDGGFCLETQCERNKIDWVICGGESGPKARPMHPDWARSVRDQCVSAGVPYFFKQWGQWVPMLGHLEGVPVHGQKFTHPDGTIMGRTGKNAAGRELDGREWSEFPALKDDR